VSLRRNPLAPGSKRRVDDMKGRVIQPVTITAFLLAVAACGESAETSATTVEPLNGSSDHQITYQVEGDATVNIWWGATTGSGDIMTTEDMNTAFATALPWSTEETVTGLSVAQLVVLPSEHREGDTVQFTCRILVDGTVNDETTGQDQWGCTASSVTP
jgi:hypothetical protein